jgi:CRISPR-associated protein Csd2
MLSKKIDFAIIIGVRNANPNGDPLNGNRPRTNYEGYGEMTDVCLKRKIRNRLMEAGEAILVQSDDYRNDEYRSIKARYDANEEVKKLVETAKSKNQENKDKKTKKNTDSQLSSDDIIRVACQEWFDVRAFGQVLAFKEKKANTKKPKKNVAETEGQEDETSETKENSVSIGVRGPVSIQSAFSLDTVDVESLQITKSVNLETNEANPAKKSGDTMGMKHRIDRGVYVTYGSINRQLAEKTGFSDEDAEKLKKAMLKMFENDESSARPAGSMEVIKLIWWTHTDKTLPSAKVHRSLSVKLDGTYDIQPLDGIKAEPFDGE